jgi:hypothetical protein
MSQVTPDDFRREKWIDGLSIHGSLRDLFFTASIYEMEKFLKIKTPRITISKPAISVQSWFWVQS